MYLDIRVYLDRYGIEVNYLCDDWWLDIVIDIQLIMNNYYWAGGDETSSFLESATLFL